ncbi:MAG: oligosaccharide flippase family protein [Anaerolineae bacterium]|nr:oligosaccharide flippase family protein [Anaerolineae bacterium]
MQQRWRDLAFVGILLLLPLLLFAPVTVGNQTLLPADALYLFEPYQAATATLNVGEPQNPLLADLILENYPWKRLLVNAIKTQQLPLWDPYLFTGHSFLANGQHSALYPLTWIFFFIPAPRAFGVFITLQLGLAGIAMYVFGRVIGAKHHEAFLAGLIFQFSGFLVISTVHPMIVAAASWLPLLLAFVDLTIRRATFLGQKQSVLPWTLSGAMVLGLQILAGHAEITYFVLLVMAAFATWRLAHTMLTQPRATWRSTVLSPVIGLAAMAGLGLALGTVQLLPLYEVVKSSFRQDAVTLNDVLGWAYPKRRILTFFVPNFFGNPTHRTLRDVFTGQIVRAATNAYGESVGAFDWGLKNYVEGAAYVGILPLLLALIAVFKPPREPGNDFTARSQIARWLLHPYVPFFTALSLFSLGCIFGTPLYTLVYALPFLNQSHSPFRWVFPLTVSLAALAGMGATTVGTFRKTHGPDGNAPAEAARTTPSPRITRLARRILLFDTSPNLVSVVAALALWSGLGLLAGLWASRLAFGQVEGLVERAFWSLARAAYTFPDHRVFYSYLFPWIQTAALLLIGTGAVLRVSRCPIYLPQRLKRRPVWEVLAAGLILLDLVTFSAGFNPAVDSNLLAYTPPVVEFLRQDTGLWRFSTFDPVGRKPFTANVGMLYDFQDVRGYDSLFTAQYARYMGWIEPQGELPYNRIAPFRQLSSLDSPLTDMLNVKYILTTEEIPLPKYRLAYQDTALRVYENLGVAPRVFTLPVSATVRSADVGTVGELMMKYDPRFYAIVEEAQVADILPLATEPQAGTPQAQTISAYGLNEVTVEAAIGGPSWLILGDAYFEGWKAFVRPPGASDDQETEVPIVRVAGNFRGVLLEQSATVRFKYSPNSVKVGAFTTFIGGMTLVFLSALWLWRRAYQETESTSAVQRIAKNSIAPILLNIFNQVLNLAFAALMLRILGPSNAGDYTYTINVFMWFEILVNFGLDAYLTREVARHREQANRYLFNTTLVRLGLSVLGIPLLVGFIALRQTLIAGVTQPASRQAMIALGLLYVGLIPGSISKGLTSLFYAYEKAEYPAAITVVSTLLRVTLGTLVLVMGMGLLGLFGSAIVINLITMGILGVAAIRLFFRPKWESHPELRREMVRESWPLMLNHLLATLFFKVDISLMEAIRGSTELGLYSIGYKFLDTLNVIPSMFTLALFPVISRQATEDKSGFSRFYHLGAKILVILALPATILATLAAREMVLVLGGPEFLPGGMIALQCMAWSMPVGWINSLTQYVLIASDQQRYLIRAYLFSFGFTVIANLILMPRFGYQASAIIHIFSELILLIFFAIGVQRQLSTVDWRGILAKPLAAAAVMGAVALLALPLGRLAAFVAAMIIYPLAAWRLQVLTPQEQALLAPIWPIKRRK